MERCERKPKAWAIASVAFVVLGLLTACRGEDRFRVFEGEASDASVTASPVGETREGKNVSPPAPTWLEAAPDATIAPLRPVAMPSQLDVAPPFDREAFLVDPYTPWDPAKTQIFTSLPDGASVKLWLRWTDANGDGGGQIRYAAAQGKRVTCKFELPGALPAQRMLLEACYLPDDPEHPQEAGFSALFGAHGQALPAPPAYEREDGGRYLLSQWSVSYPDEATAVAHLEAAWLNAIGGRAEEWHFEDGVFVVRLDEREIGLEAGAFFELCTAHTKAYLQALCRLPSYADPALRLHDAAGQVRCERGSDRHPEIDMPRAVYVTEGGARYHEAGCQYAEGSRQMALFAAEILGYTPCKICH